METAAAVITVLVVAAAALWLAARRPGGLALGRSRAAGPAELVQRLPLTAQHNLHLVRFAGETLWVVTYPNGAVVSAGKAFPEWLAEAAMAGQESRR
jgi:hypothetical protein